MNSAEPETTPPLDANWCRAARLARDPRFDGTFFLAVRTTGIYCRPVCPARPPAEKNVRYFRSAEQAAAAGFRPCLRCRPESAPGSPAWNGSATTVGRALQLIRGGALNDGRLPDLAARLGVGERYLRKLFQRELGCSPLAVAHNQRLLFAKKLLAETPLPITEVAYAAGFGSVRRFNSAVQAQFRLTPSELRGGRRRHAPTAEVELLLHYRPPYDWEGVLDFFSRHAIPAVEQVAAGCYRRSVRLGAGTATCRVSHLPSRHALRLVLDAPEPGHLMPLVGRLRRMFDLDADPAAIETTLSRDPFLRPLLRERPGVRSPVYWSTWEAAVRAVAGQQVSTAAARTVLGRLARAADPNAQRLSFPGPAQLAALEDSAFAMPGRRRDNLRLLCAAFDGEREPDHEDLAALPGIGPWTAAMIAMRGAGAPDSFPAGDLGLDKAWRALAGGRIDLHHQQRQWRPWRAYAANLLWRSLAA